MKVIRLEGKSSKYQTISLQDICSVLAQNNYGADCSWSIDWFEAVVKPSFPFSLLNFENKINKDKNPHITGFAELQSIANSIEDAVNVIVKSYCGSNYQSDSENNERAVDLRIELFDSTYWEIEARDSQIIRSLEMSFAAQ